MVSPRVSAHAANICVVVYCFLSACLENGKFLDSEIDWNWCVARQSCE